MRKKRNKEKSNTNKEKKINGITIIVVKKI
jgi:hypothetical protein